MRLLMACLTALSLMLPAPTPAGAQEEPIQGTIQSQIDAFLADDFDTAFTFASPTIKSMFGTAENFGAMVRNGYPMVHRPKDVRMGELRNDEGLLWQRVFVTDAQGRGHVLDYQMIQTAEGWKINGVYLLRADDVGV
ncbi:MAG: DUF4864 domain-containing protein [Tabrizicola sp.]|nr:DUF4864 domain-containing protein [Tabrizicola sp.]